MIRSPSAFGVFLFTLLISPIFAQADGQNLRSRDEDLSSNLNARNLHTSPFHIGAIRRRQQLAYFQRQIDPKENYDVFARAAATSLLVVDDFASASNIGTSTNLLGFPASADNTQQAGTYLNNAGGQLNINVVQASTYYYSLLAQDKVCASDANYDYLVLRVKFPSTVFAFDIQVQDYDATCATRTTHTVTASLTSTIAPLTNSLDWQTLRINLTAFNVDKTRLHAIVVANFANSGLVAFDDFMLAQANAVIPAKTSGQPVASTYLVIDDFNNAANYLAEKNSLGAYTSDDRTMAQLTYAASGALWLVTQAGAYFYSLVGPDKVCNDISAYAALQMRVRFPSTAPPDFLVGFTQVDAATCTQRTNINVKLSTNAATASGAAAVLQQTNDWQIVSIPFSYFTGLDGRYIQSMGISGFTTTVPMQIDIIRLSSTADVSQTSFAAPPNVPARLPEVALTYTTDGTCGVNALGISSSLSCTNAAPCCSAAGKCSSSAADCGTGCQKGYGICGNNNVVTGTGGSWALVGRSGVAAQHAWIHPNTNSIIFVDRQQDYEELQYNGANAYACEYDLTANVCIPFGITTNAFCSAGAWLQNNTMVMLGGQKVLPDNPGNLLNGINGIRMLSREPGAPTDFMEYPALKMSSGRWYPFAVNLPDNRIFVLSGLSAQGQGTDTQNPTWEWIGKGATNPPTQTQMPWILESDPYELYPYIYVMRSGKLFIKAGVQAILFSPDANTFTRLQTPHGPGRNYPNTGSSVMFPLSAANNWRVELMFCGGSAPINGQYFDTNNPATDTCAILAPEDDRVDIPQWRYVQMPNQRVMGDGLILPDGQMLFINGAANGAQGYWSGNNPVYSPDLYNPTQNTWTTLAPTTIERLYHSIAHLLPDGRVLITGSTPNDPPLPVVGTYANRFEVEIFTPPYLVGVQDSARPVIVSAPAVMVPNGLPFTFMIGNVAAAALNDNANRIKVMMITTGFVTHSIHMNERSLLLAITASTANSITVQTPPDIYTAIPAPYMLFLTVDGVPSHAAWVRVAPA